jgi:hypothetical protein
MVHGIPLKRDMDSDASIYDLMKVEIGPKTPLLTVKKRES